MYILNNAVISITRNKGRNILIGVIILVIACACTITLAINNTANDLINSYESAYKKEVTISFDRNSMMKDFDFSKESAREEMKENFNNISSFTIEDVENYADSDHIESYYYTYGISLDGENIEKAENKNDEEDFSKPFPGGNNNSMQSEMDFTVTGYSSLDAMSEFIDGTYKVTDIEDDAWDKAFDGNYVFINKELASYNDLSLGDTIKLKDDDNNIYSFKIIGIFEDNNTSNSNMMSMFSNSANTIITNSHALISITDSNEDINASVIPTFIIDSYDNADIIEEQFYEKGLDENYVVETNEELANSGLNGVSNVKSFATTFLIITLIIGGVVLVILNMINIRERKYEIGVLRTIGISKFKLTLQFITELILVTVFALLLGAGIGATMSKSVSNALLSSEIESAKTSSNDMANNFNPGRGMPDFSNFPSNGIVDISAYNSIDAVVNIQVVIELLGIGILLVLISSLSAMISIQRFSPLTILKERS